MDTASCRLEIRPLEAPLGAEVLGLERERGIDEPGFAQLVAALRAHQLLVLRGAPRSNASLVALARRLGGEVVTFYEPYTTEPGFPEILRVSNVARDGQPIGVGGREVLAWHADYCYLERPGKESLLEAVELPRSGSTTSFLDTYCAWETLPAALRERLAGRRALHRIQYPGASPRRVGAGADPRRAPKLGNYLVAYDYPDATNARAREQIDARCATHPVAVRHPDTGRVALYVSPLGVESILGLSAAESEDLLERLFEHTIRSERIYDHRWQVGDLVVFDTLGTLHYRDAFPADERRFMKQLSTLCPGPLAGPAAGA
jgi:taurine dioxygenase